jgi:hypothetical protein
MNFSVIQNVLWAASFAVNVVLLFILVSKKRIREFPVFSVWIGFLTAEMAVLFLIYRWGSDHSYSVVYWSCVLVDFLLQLGVVMEIARIVLRPTGTWIFDAWGRFLVSGCVGIVIAASTALLLHPKANSSLDIWEIRGNLFTGIIIVELFSAMTGAANRLGLQWRSHVMGLGQGLFLWSTIAVLVDALHNVLGRYRWFTTLDNLRVSVWIAAAIYWTLVFWKPERKRNPLSPEMEQYLLDLHHRVKFDLSRSQESLSRLRK